MERCRTFTATEYYKFFAETFKELGRDSIVTSLKPYFAGFHNPLDDMRSGEKRIQPQRVRDRLDESFPNVDD